ncbi:hypothetical protein CFC21_076358 [Triticum aestivum]|uniref:DUF4220 domain-containing protein n=7 Tax=Triticinae TaxID=1648030 RepID=A0A9R1DSV0_WHEAT|nr:hypothetical protein CFC21_013790 [Triticum aestivum]KAF7070923.1 hypothetical protein CFC21_076358 [Triticum aestivum]
MDRSSGEVVECLCVPGSAASQLTHASHPLCLSESRRREGKGWKRGSLWLAYLLTDWGPAYVISNLYLETSPRDKIIIAFWVPFLLLHHARPDNISAYTMEDNELWLRLFLLALVKSLGSFIIVYRYILTECTADWFLRWASGIMLPLGILKYLESMLALRRSDLGRIRDHGLSNKQTYTIDDYRGDQGKPLVLKDDEALLVAHNLFEVSKGAFCDYKAKIDRDDITRMLFFGRWENMCTVVEMELSLMYDILYTKAAVVHTWHGYVIRLASPPLTATALLFFGLHCKKAMKKEDEVISYVLLVTTFLFDVRWLLRALASAWTHSYFKLMPHNWLKHEFWCQEVWEKLRRFVVSLCLSRLSVWLGTCSCPKVPKSYRRWVGTFGQLNLLDQCTAGNRHNLYSIPRLATESRDHSRSRGFQSEGYSRGLEIPDSVKKLVFSNICTNLFPDPAGSTNPQQPSYTDSPRSPRPPGKGPTDPQSSDTDTDRSPQPPGKGKPSTGLTGPEHPGGDVTPKFPEWPGHEKAPTGLMGFEQPGGTIIPCPGGWPGCGSKLPNYCTCVHPRSLDPHEHCLGILCGPQGPPYPREQMCNGVNDEPTLRLPYPREQMCNGVNDEPTLWPLCPREWICNDLDDQAAPWRQYPAERFCNSTNSEPPRLPYPWQVSAGMRNAPSEESNFKQQTYRWRYDRTPEPYEQVNLWRNVNASSGYDVKAASIKPTDQSDKDMGFPLELQEVILIWHIATDVFLSCSPRITGEESEEHAEVIKQMSDYMMFLIAKRPEMLPGLKLRSLYEETRDTLRKIRGIKAKIEGRKHTSYSTDEKKELLNWMLVNMGLYEGLRPAIVLEGTRLAWMLLSQVSKDGGSETAGEAPSTVGRLAYWIPRLLELPVGDMDDMLELVLDAWVRLLMYASIRCGRDAHAKQLSWGGELTTLVWIITEHAKNSVVKRHLESLFR